MAVFEVRKPAFRGAIDVSNYRRQTVPRVAFGLAANRIFELLETLLSRCSSTAFEVIPKKIEATGLGSINDSGLFRMQ